MESPIKLNFLLQAEIFQELKFLDEQFELSFKQWKHQKEWKKQIDNNKRGVSLNLPTWNIEKKILRWSFLGSKHLDSPISTDRVLKDDFQRDIEATYWEINFANPRNILGNLVSRGFATWKTDNGVEINEKGRLFASLIFYTQKLRDVNPQEEAGMEKILKNNKIGYKGYKFLLFSLIILSILSVLLVIVTFLNQAHLLDDARRIIPFLPVIKVAAIDISIVAFLLFILALTMIEINHYLVNKYFDKK